MSDLLVFSEWSNWAWRLALNHLWQATIFFVIALLASLLLRRGPARARYVVWLAASIKSAVPSAVIILALSGVGIKVESIFDSSPSSTPTLHYITPMEGMETVTRELIVGYYHGDQRVKIENRRAMAVN